MFILQAVDTNSVSEGELAILVYKITLPSYIDSTL